jgi:patatin-like phospholipase/acyl hydrolase
LILAEIMKSVKGPNGEPLKPYQCFDLIVGTSTGGYVFLD